MPDRASRLVAKPLGHVDLAELARPQERDGVLNALVAAALSAGLDDALVLRAASTMRRPSLTLWLTGFSTYTSLPAWQAQMVARACQWLGVAIEMASIDLSSSRRRMSWTILGAVLVFRSTSLAPRLGDAQIDVADRGDAHVFEVVPAGDVFLAPPVDAANGNLHGIIWPARLGVALTVVRGCDGVHSRNRGHCSRQFSGVCKKLSAG